MKTAMELLEIFEGSSYPAWGGWHSDEPCEVYTDREAGMQAVKDAIFDELIADWTQENGSLDLWDDQGNYWSIPDWLRARRKATSE